ncbi:glycosyltransferase, partial [Candidatus Gottesmanbacteria bacterium]|nr:glycosyltransferase [Candidatus Gottesmanbacteria bacterium]
ISFITTVLNEEKTIENLLNSLMEQTRMPDEIIIVDGGSKDNTVAKIAQEVRYYVFPGANRARGRNEAIKKAKGEIIAISDAGCVLDKNWLKNITKPFNNPKVDVVAGYYQPVTRNIFEKCLACYTCVMPDRLASENFLPSSRSIALRKTAWQAVSGYPEDLDYCEDLVFAQRLKERDFKFVLAKEALVFWPQKKNISQAFWQFFNYASGDAQARYWPHVAKIILVYFRYFLALLLPILGFVYHILIYNILVAILILSYLLWSIFKNYRYVEHPSAFIYLPLLQIAADLAVMVGFLRGIFKRYGIL